MLDYFRFKEINDLYASGKTERARRLLMEMQSCCIALRDEISLLKIRIQSMEDALFLAENLYLDKGFYWLRLGGVIQGPFCPECYGRDGALIRLENYGGAFHCAFCGETYATAKPGKDVRENVSEIRQARILPFVR